MSKVALFIFFLLMSLQVFFHPGFSESSKKFFSPLKNQKYIALGFNDTISDSLWIHYLQNLWDCTLESTCKKTWGYQVLDEVTDLSPHFFDFYFKGALMLNTISKDEVGAGKIYEKGIEYFPKNWNILYYGATHFAHELKQPKKAGPLYIEASKYGAPAWTKTLGNRLLKGQ